MVGFFNIKMTSTASVFRDTILTIFKGSMFARNNTNDMDIRVNLTLTLEVCDDRRLDRKKRSEMD